MAILPAIIDTTGPVLSAEEAALLKAYPPFGIILFQRHCQSPEQVRKLIEDCRAASGNPDLAVLIDQEGGRVMRLKPPVWPDMPSPSKFGELAKTDLQKAKDLAREFGRQKGVLMADLGINVNCAPMLDVPAPDAHQGVIGTRAWSADLATLIELTKAYAEGLKAGGVLPVIKHMPGHGRATVDSHLSMPRVTASEADLAAKDFAAFKALADEPLGMTAHVLYPALDPQKPATLSPAIIRNVIRGQIGFKGILMTDDLTMKALSAPYPQLAAEAIAAGCDLAMLCNGINPVSLADREATLKALPPLSPSVAAQWQQARAGVGPRPQPPEAQAAVQRLAEINSKLTA